MIRYHGTPLTPVETMINALKGKNAMICYENPAQVEEACEVCQSVVGDNGTYPAFMDGRKPDFVGYLKWVRFWRRHPAFDWFLIPDLIDGTASENRRLVEDWPLPRAISVPVYHYHEPLEYLAWLMANFHRVALGSSGEYIDVGGEKWWSRTAEIMDFVCDEDGMPKVKLHGLRMLDTEIFSRVPLSSADSTNVARNIGLDVRWKGTYVPRRKISRAIVMIQNIEDHRAAHRWNRNGVGSQQTMELLAQSALS